MGDSAVASITVENASVIFPIYGSKSIKNTAIKKATKIFQRSLGGNIEFGADNTVHIEALKNVSISIEHGEKVGIVGQNGSGKSTLLRMLAGVYQPVSGTVKVNGAIVPFLNISLGIDGDLTGYECIFLRGLMLGLTKKEIADKADEIADFSELGPYLEMPTRTYSSGMLMRLAFSIATAVEPGILVMDEWMSVGDVFFQEKAQKRLNDLVAKSKILVLASHSMELIQSLCTRILFLENGMIVDDKPVTPVAEETA